MQNFFKITSWKCLLKSVYYELLLGMFVCDTLINNCTANAILMYLNIFNLLDFALKEGKFGLHWAVILLVNTYSA